MLQGKNRFITLEVILLIISIILVIVSSVSRGKYDNKSIFYLNSLTYNWNRSPITEIIESKTTTCPKGYGPLINDYWPGLTPSCICNGYEMNNMLHGKVRRGYCRSKRDSFLFCKSFPRVRGKPYFKYKGKMLCAKRLGQGYFDLGITRRASYCRGGSRACGIADSLKNFLCVPNKLPCPINNMRIINKGDSIPTIYKYEKIELDNNKVLIFTNQDTEGMIYEEFRLSQDDLCSNPYYSNYKNTPYILDPFYGRDKCKESITNDLYDNRYVKLDSSKNYTQILQENGISAIVNKLPGYQNNSTDYPVHLYSRPYVGIRDHCFDFFSGKNRYSSKSILDDIKSIRTYSYSASAFSIQITFFIVLICMTTVFGTIIFLYFLCSDEERYVESKTCQYVFKGILAFLFFVMIILFIILSSKIRSIPDKHNDIKNLNLDECGDRYTNEAFLQIHNSLSSAKTLNIICILFAVGGFILIGVLIYLIYITPNLPPRPQNEEEGFFFF